MSRILRRMMVGVGILIVLLVLGLVIPRLLIGDGVGAYQAEDQEYAQLAGLYARHLVCSGPEALFCTAVRVVALRPVTPEQGAGCRYPYTAETRAYTIFGIPYATVITDCNLSHTYRQGQP